MSEPCTLTTHKELPDWCSHHQRYHTGHQKKWALGTDENSRQMRHLWDQLLEKDRPSFLQKLGHYTGSTFRHILSGFKTVPDEIHDQRAAICKECPSNVNNECIECGCPTKPTLIGDKLRRATESCDMNPPKWGVWKPSAVNFWEKIFRNMVPDDGWPSSWWAQPETQQAFRNVLKEKISENNESPGYFQGRGVVILGGGERYGVGVYVATKMLRHHGWKEGIQIWHRGVSEPLPAGIFEQLGAELIDANQFRESHPCRRWGMDKWGDPDNRWLSWGLKSYAVLHSPFREVLYLDADAYPVAPIDRLFDNRAGTLVWYDLPGMASNLRWDVYGITPDSGRGWQGGQWLIDKSKCWKALNLYRWLDDWSDYTYRYGYGDQDNLRLAWQATSTPHHAYTFRGQEVFTQPFMGCLRAWDDQGGFVIQHRITDKMFQRNFWDEVGYSPDQHKRVRWYDEDKVHGYAQEYRQKSRSHL
ncbi:MAG: hypothetical protein JNJ77_20015 [Planctomycetia bacterium]|nr:hypothetical protein [Planctomycetia bacterium]